MWQPHAFALYSRTSYRPNQEEELIASKNRLYNGLHGVLVCASSRSASTVLHGSDFERQQRGR